MERPIFILSIPRSGSTLLQRILTGTSECATLGETSLLLRLLGEPKDISRYSSYREQNIEIAKDDIRKNWNGFDDSYRRHVRFLMEDIYTNLAEGKRFFIDKTPRYTLIIDEIYKTFPDAYYILLFRHPLAVAASLSNTFRSGHWWLDNHRADLTTALDKLYAFHKAHEATPNVTSIRYEDLVADNKRTLLKINEMLGIKEFETPEDVQLSTTNRGRLGDPTGISKYKNVSMDSLEKWIDDYKNFYRVRWAKKYFGSLNPEFLEEFKYEFPEILRLTNPKFMLRPGFSDLINQRRLENKARKRTLRMFKNKRIIT
ncbi:sulfotransferase family protein [Coraliomargarita parva]|uniref:sulfotransferase family protein n=1 Tax=Coraliomargarita parva TaxID=3014050 RepID=UPI0022B4A175|nr:sulfotransferase [Coraliomargarita parva]